MGKFTILLLAEHGRGTSHLLFKYLGEVVYICEAGGGCNLVNAQIGIAGQQLLGLADAFVGDVFRKAAAYFFVEVLR